MVCFENHAEWRMCLVLVQRLSRSVALKSACSARWRCCLPSLFLDTLWCHVLFVALSVVGSCVTDFTTSHAWLKLKVMRTASPTFPKLLPKQIDETNFEKVSPSSGGCSLRLINHSTTNQQPTNNQPTTNQQPTNNQPTTNNNLLLQLQHQQAFHPKIAPVCEEICCDGL